MSPRLNVSSSWCLFLHELVDVALVEEQLERIEVLDERLQAALGDRVVQPLAGEMLPFHQRRDGERDLAVGGVRLRRLGVAIDAARDSESGGQQCQARKQRPSRRWVDCVIFEVLRSPLVTGANATRLPA